MLQESIRKSSLYSHLENFYEIKARIVSGATSQGPFIILVNSLRPRMSNWFGFSELQLNLSKLMHPNFCAVSGQNNLKRERK